MVRIYMSEGLYRCAPRACKTVVLLLGALFLLNVPSFEFFPRKSSPAHLRALRSDFKPIMWSLTSRISEAFDDDSLIDAVASSMGSLTPGGQRPQVLLTRWEPSNSERRAIAVNSTAPSAIEQEVTLLVVIHGTTKEQAVVRAPTRSPGAQDVIHLLSQFQVTLLPYPAGKPRIVGYVDGQNLTSSDPYQLVAVLEESNGVFETAVDDHGVFSFTSDTPDGHYLLSLRGAKYFTEPARTIVLHSSSDVKVALFRVRPIGIAFEASSAYRWQRDGTLAGHEVMSGKPQHLAPRLARDYNIMLNSNFSDLPWSRDLATRLRRTLETIPMVDELGITHWNLTDIFVNHDIEINKTNGITQVVISMPAFRYARPMVAKRPAGAYFSKRLYMACVRFVIDNVQDESSRELPESRRLRRLAYLLRERFGVEVSWNDIDYEVLTRYTTEEDREDFQSFSSTELISIVAMLEEMPQGLHKIPNLHTLVRRKTTRRNPSYTNALALAHKSSGYIEFTDRAFMSSSEEAAFRVILHEKAHFLYVDSTLIPLTLKLKWISIGGWSQNSTKWTTKEELTFVSSYAHKISPEEDFAESFAAYIRQPDHLRRRALNKYNFLRNHIVNGIQYETRYREDLIFEVFNLWPDVDPVGRVDEITIIVRGDDDADKTVHIRITLSYAEGKNDTATSASLGLKHSTESTATSAWLYPVNQLNLSHVLEGTVSLSKYAPAGDWTADQVVLNDDAGNHRYISVTNYGWKCNVKNVLADYILPSYIHMSITHSMHAGRQIDEQLVKVRWFLVEQHMKLSGCYASLLPPRDPTQGTQMDSIGNWGYAEETAHQGTFTCEVKFYIPPFYRSGKYEVGMLMMSDLAGHTSYQTFHSTRASDVQGRYLEPPHVFDVQTDSPDAFPPRINPNSIRISARRRHADRSNGETLVVLSVDICDIGIAGVASIQYNFADPFDQLTGGSIKHDNMYTLSFEGNPEAWKSYSTEHTLPAGSQPGFWALHSLILVDKARNVKNYSFKKVVQSYSPAEAGDGLFLMGPEEPHRHVPTNTNETVKCHTCTFWIA